MVSYTVRMQFSKDDRDRVTEILRNLALASREEPGCVTFVPHHVDGDPETVLVYEQYRDQAAVDAHRASPHFKQFAVGGLYQLMKQRATESLDAII
jgi:quinol monooxygenase YgiN